MSPAAVAHLDPPVSDVDHLRGGPAATWTLVEYGDFQCPPCIQAYGEVRRLERLLGEDLRVVFRHFPLVDMHPLAFGAARAAEAAGSQGRFWQMHDRLFEAGGALEPSQLREYAGDIGLDVARFDHELGKHGFRDRVSGDMESGVRSAVRGTPTFFVHNVQHVGSYDAETLAAAIEGTR